MGFAQSDSKRERQFQESTGFAATLRIAQGTSETPGARRQERRPDYSQVFVGFRGSRTRDRQLIRLFLYH